MLAHLAIGNCHRKQGCAPCEETTRPHCQESRRLFAGATKQSFSLSSQTLRRSVVLSLLLIVFLFIPQSVHATYLSYINITWQSDIPAAIQSRIESAINSREGEGVSESQLARILESTLALLADHGYRHARLEPRDFKVSNDSLAFALSISPGRVTYISGWQFAGLVRTDSLWLANSLNLPIGVSATGDAIRCGVRSLAQFPNLALVGPPEVLTVPGDSLAVIRLTLREATPARFEGAVAAGSNDGVDRTLLGRFSLGLDGLFRRDHSVALRYEHPQPDERLLRLEYSERLAFTRHLSTHLRLEDWRRADHRQQAGLNAAIGLGQQRRLTVTTGLSWQKLTPLAAATLPARVSEGSIGAAWGDSRADHLAARAVYSHHRQWDVAGLDSRKRMRVETEGKVSKPLAVSTLAHLSFGARWWGKGERLRAGDEWFLGGDILRGYSARSVAATAGLWSRFEIARQSRSGLGASLFGELAWLEMFDLSYQRPQSFGVALLLDSPGRSGRIELAWRDRAALRDGILRLSVIQGW